jgi:hypothetical protein
MTRQKSLPDLRLCGVLCNGNDAGFVIPYLADGQLQPSFFCLKII